MWIGDNSQLMRSGVEMRSDRSKQGGWTCPCRIDSAEMSSLVVRRERWRMESCVGYHRMEGRWWHHRQVSIAMHLSLPMPHLRLWICLWCCWTLMMILIPFDFVQWFDLPMQLPLHQEQPRHLRPERTRIPSRCYSYWTVFCDEGADDGVVLYSLSFWFWYMYLMRMDECSLEISSLINVNEWSRAWS